MNKKIIGVVGAGTMGADLALELSQFGFKVILKDISQEKLDEAKSKIVENLKIFKFLIKDRKWLKRDEILSNISFELDYEKFKDVDLVFENITENWDAKKGVFEELSNYCRKDVIYAINTSCISITKIGNVMPDSSKVIGTHFMNPVPMKKMVEVIKGFHTSQETIDETVNLLKHLTKTPVVVNDFPGFVTNRVLMLMINESIWALQDGVAEAKDIDKIFRTGFGHKMGPLATADLIGLDTILNSLIVLYEDFRDTKFRPCPLLIKMVDANHLGKKSGIGFFDYTE